MNGSKKKFILSALIAIVLVLAFCSYGVRYLVQEIDGTSSRIVEGKKNVFILRSRSGQLADTRRAYQQTEGQIDQAFATVIDRDRTVEFIKAAEGAADSNRVKLEIKAGGDAGASKSQSGFITSSDFSFKVGGNFSSVMKFLATLENSPYALSISDVKMSSGDFDEYNKGLVILEFKLKLYQKDSQK